jgi:hypothetical protein
MRKAVRPAFDNYYGVFGARPSVVHRRVTVDRAAPERLAAVARQAAAATGGDREQAPALCMLVVEQERPSVR